MQSTGNYEKETEMKIKTSAPKRSTLLLGITFEVPDVSATPTPNEIQSKILIKVMYEVFTTTQLTLQNWWPCYLIF